MEALDGDESIFMMFDDAATYQVNISLIEELTDLTFQKGIDCYTDERSLKLVLDEVDIDPELESYSVIDALGFDILNINL